MARPISAARSLREPSAPRHLLLAVLGVAALSAAGTAWSLARAIVAGRRLTSTRTRYIRRRRGARVRLLVVGDSSGVGVGATAAECTIAGRIGRWRPEWTIGNLARNGSRTADVVALLARLHRRVGQRRYTWLIVHTGGNDAMHGTSTAAMRSALDRALELGARLADHTMLVTGGNLALAPAFWPPFTWMLDRQSRRVRGLCREAASRHHAVFVDLFHERRDDPTVPQPRTYFAADGLHPSDANYELWFQAMRPMLEAPPAPQREPSCGPWIA